MWLASGIIAYCVLWRVFFSAQVSRLIEMQTPLYLEGVQHLHPYFSKPNRELLSIGFNSLSQSASWPVFLFYVSCSFQYKYVSSTIVSVTSILLLSFTFGKMLWNVLWMWHKRKEWMCCRPWHFVEPWITIWIKELLKLMPLCSLLGCFDSSAQRFPSFDSTK